MKEERFSISKRIRSFGYALKGIGRLIRREHNAWIHTACAITAVALGIGLKISTTEWIAVTGCIGLVLMAEGFNSSIEALCDKVSPEMDPLIGHSKDLAAGAVLIAAIAAAVIGMIIFLPKLI